MAYLDFMAYARGGQAGRAQAEREATFNLQYPVAQAGVDDAMAARQANADNYTFQAQALRDAVALPPEQRAAFLAQRVQETLQGLDPTNPAAARQAAQLSQFALRQSDARRQAGDVAGATVLGQTGFGINPMGLQDAGQRDMQGYVNALQNTDAPYYFSTTQNKWLPLAAERAALAWYANQPTTGAPTAAAMPAGNMSYAPGMQPLVLSNQTLGLQGPPVAQLPGSTGPTLTMPTVTAMPAAPVVPAAVSMGPTFTQPQNANAPAALAQLQTSMPQFFTPTGEINPAFTAWQSTNGALLASLAKQAQQVQFAAQEQALRANAMGWLTQPGAQR